VGKVDPRVVVVVFLLASAALGKPSMVEQVSDVVWVARDDNGNWGGGTMGITHQRHPTYEAKKILDLSNLPQRVWESAKAVRLSAYFCVRDYSLHDLAKSNGLDEAFEVVINGKVHRYPTRCGAPVYKERHAVAESIDWYDFILPKDEFVRGRNEIIFRKAQTADKAPDDYLYLGIDTSVPSGNSFVKFGKDAEWRQDKLTVPGGAGEYMIRLYIICGDTKFQAVWCPAEGKVTDPYKIFEYLGSHSGAIRVEWNPLRLDKLQPVRVMVVTGTPDGFAFRWLDENGNPRSAIEAKGAEYEARLDAPLPFRPSGVQLPRDLPLKSLTLMASMNYHPLPSRLNMAPHIAKPKGKPADRAPSCRLERNRAVLANDNLRCEFKIGGNFRLASLYNELAAAEMLRKPESCALFMVEVNGERFSGSRDFVCKSVQPLKGRKGFAAELFNEKTALKAELRVWIDDALRMGLTVTNTSGGKVDFKVAFPHLSGLSISDNPADDYYFYPWGGGIFSDAPAIIRRGYGDHGALYQLMDIFSPSRGAGFAVRCTDDDGRYKVLALRKFIRGSREFIEDKAITPTADEFKWTNSLEPVEGIGFTYEYLRRTRDSGESFQLKDVAMKAHAGDWHAAMREYADWCHRVWKFRPHPSRLKSVINMIAAGWGKSPLFRDGKYRTDFIQPMCDCIELMSWWEWSTVGPWGVPVDKVEQAYLEDKLLFRRWTNYIIKDPATGKLMFNNNPGDYDGYNVRWGGLPALRKAIETYKRMGALVTLYTDPIRCDYNSKTGKKYGRLWGVVTADGKHLRHYDAWGMCHDVAEYRQWVADTMKRVMKETGADGIRLDEYGHKGWACFSKLHKHTFAEWGCTEWQRAIAETTKLVHRAMDEVRPDAILTTEHPGYDFLMQFIDGCITYDLTVHASPLRPLECNLQRFYFPECKPFELDHRGADRKHRKRFWNGVASFGKYYPTNMYNILKENNDAFSSRDCEPLIPTPSKFIYANRFSAGRKTVFTIYNATGHSFFGSVLRVNLKSDEHIFDLLNCKEANYENGAVKAFLLRDDVLCLVRLPITITVQRDGREIEVLVRGARQDWKLALCDKDGNRLVSQKARDVAAPSRFNRRAGMREIVGGVEADRHRRFAARSGIAESPSRRAAEADNPSGIVNYLAVNDSDHAPRMASEVALVSNHDHRLPQLLVEFVNQLDDFAARFRVEVAGRLVEEEDFGVVHERPRYRHPLPLAAG